MNTLLFGMEPTLDEINTRIKQKFCLLNLQHIITSYF